MTPTIPDRDIGTAKLFRANIRANDTEYKGERNGTGKPRLHLRQSAAVCICFTLHTKNAFHFCRRLPQIFSLDYRFAPAHFIHRVQIENLRLASPCKEAKRYSSLDHPTFLLFLRCSRSQENENGVYDLYSLAARNQRTRDYSRWLFLLAFSF